MPRCPRIIIPGEPFHLVQYGQNRQPCFFADEDYRHYLAWLKQGAGEAQCAVHAYVLMTNHVHLLVTPTHQYGAATLMKSLGQNFTHYFNRTYLRSGALWDGRYRSCLVQQNWYVLLCQRYIELNPVRAGLVGHPGGYPWSSYHANAYGDDAGIITPHPMFIGLGQTSVARRAAYRAILASPLPPLMVDEITNTSTGNNVLGLERFTMAMEKIVGRRIKPGKPGRPRKHPGVDKL